MNKKCQVFTPSDYVEKLLDSVGYKHDLYGKMNKILFYKECYTLETDLLQRYMSFFSINKYLTLFSVLSCEFPG